MNMSLFAFNSVELIISSLHNFSTLEEWLVYQLINVRKYKYTTISFERHFTLRQ